LKRLRKVSWEGGTHPVQDKKKKVRKAKTSAWFVSVEVGALATTKKGGSIKKW